jgi:prephenate dehydratase
MKTAFLGPRGTFSEEAALAYTQGEGELEAFSSFPALTEAVESGRAEAAVLPIENSIGGSVITTLDLLIHETPLKISAEVVVPVRHFLVSTPGATLDGIKVVTSHPQGLAQCRRFIERSLPEADQVAALSTAGAVQEVSEAGDPTRAAIGPRRAVELYGGHVLAEDIQDVHTNVTRFVALTHHDTSPTGDDKTSLAFTVRQNVPGALHKVLTYFAEADIQLTKVESRPTQAWLGDYVFLIDFEGHRDDPHVARAIERAREACATLTVFGSYPRFPLESLRSVVAAAGFPNGSNPPR